MRPEIAELSHAVEAASRLLLASGEKRWGEWLRSDAERIRSLDFYGVEHLLSAFGGIGSLNDLVLHPSNGHSITAADADGANGKVRSLLSSIYTQAERLRREEGRGAGTRGSSQTG